MTRGEIVASSEMPSGSSRTVLLNAFGTWHPLWASVRLSNSDPRQQERSEASARPLFFA